MRRRGRADRSSAAIPSTRHAEESAASPVLVPRRTKVGPSERRLDVVTFERTAGLVALAWLVGAFALMARSIQRGRALADALATRHPELYESLGRPRPGYLDSAERRRFAHFVGRREFEALPDPVLAAQFEEHRKAENRLLVSLLSSLGALGLLVFLVRGFA